MARSQVITLQVDPSSALDCLQGIKTALLEFESFIETPLKILHCLINSGDLLFEVRSIHFDACSTSTFNLCLIVEPGDALRMFAAALRAGNWDGLVT
ncbi:hypothetical protein ACJJH9_16980 [Microbulbifer sp. DLAB2-AF]|uniref:hypothetical protein n=1 Tax=Microbulbifer sp. DLAB2-AF TaxID=3243395 RepID=UPI004039333D